MRVFNPRVMKEVKRIVFNTSWYTKKVNSMSREKAAPRLLYREEEADPPARTSREDRLVWHRPKLKYMRTDPMRRRVMGRKFLYWFDCRCGAMPILTADEAINRDAIGLGCGGRRCTVPAIDRQIWYVPKLALRLQIMQIRTLFPDHELLNLDTDELISTIMDNLRLRKAIREGCHWITGVAEPDCLLEDTLELRDTPDPELFPEGEIMVNIGQLPITLNELCEMYEKDFNRALELRLECSDDLLLEKLLGDER